MEWTLADTSVIILLTERIDPRAMTTIMAAIEIKVVLIEEVCVVADFQSVEEHRFRSKVVLVHLGFRTIEEIPANTVPHVVHRVVPIVSHIEPIHAAILVHQQRNSLIAPCQPKPCADERTPISIRQH